MSGSEQEDTLLGLNGLHHLRRDSIQRGGLRVQNVLLKLVNG
jgi:hypothetical protein